MEKTIRNFKYVSNELEVNQTTAAILVLAEAVRSAAPFNDSNSENFGHELALALKNVLKESTIHISKE